MNLLTQGEVRRLAVKHGFPRRPARILSAISLCEAPGENDEGEPCSDFDLVGDQELSTKVWEYSRSGYQIRCLWAEKGTGSFRDPLRMSDPDFATHSAFVIWEDRGFQPWSTFTSGMFKAYLQNMFPPPPDTYVVVAGDTLSGIGTKVGVDWQMLARINNIHAPYDIFIGQHILLPDGG